MSVLALVPSTLPAVLFVDDEQRVLDGLRRSLFPVRNRWDIRTACGGQAALAMMAERPAWVVISDLRMPGMDGLTFLQEVAARWPDAVRIVLSGQTELEVAMRVVPVAHQFLSKPVDVEVLKAAIARAEKLGVLFEDQGLRSLVARFGCLPAMPQAYAQLTGLLRDEHAGLRQIAEAVEQVTGASGVGVVIEAQHMCMMMRGVEKQNSTMVTSVMLGHFRSNAATRSEFLSLIN